MDELEEFFTHPVTITPADAADGDVDDFGRPISATPIEARAWVEEKTGWIRGEQSMIQTIATVTLPIASPCFGVGSTITCPSGLTGTVIAVQVANGTSLGLPSHVTYTLT